MGGMFDSYSADKMSEEEPSELCTTCLKVNCDCDEQTMQAMEQDDADRAESEQQHIDEGLDG